jgi:pyruvate, water dikinase
MNTDEKISTGLKGFDQAIDYLRFGDNVVWQVDSVSGYRMMVDPYVTQAKADGRKIIYVRFGSHPPILEDCADIQIHHLAAKNGFERFTIALNHLVEQEGKGAFYVFDCLSDLLEYWHSDLMIGNFFTVVCPLLFDMEAIAYFAIIRNVHTSSTIARIRETTQLLLDLYRVNRDYYIHPIKVWNRFTSTMFFPQLIQGQKAISITASAEATKLFSSIRRGGEKLDYWDELIRNAEDALVLETEQKEATKRLLMSILIGRESRIYDLCNRYFNLSDILKIASRVVGTGFIGGKSVGMLVARKILERDGEGRFTPYMEPHDSFYIASDVFYTYIVQNGWWKLHRNQKTKEGYFKYAPELKEKMLHGKFPNHIREKFIQVLEYFGQSPIIVRSSSLLEDNFGNAFAGKYESAFCVNQGTLEERCEALEHAIRFVYASTMSEDALAYRLNRGLAEKEEQMAILLQRVSGDHYDDVFFPHMAGVGNSSNLYVWDKNINMDAGMLRLVFGLGTRAVDRVVGDYVRIVTLDDPTRLPLMDAQEVKKFSQHDVDVLSLKDNQLTTRSLNEILQHNLKVDKELFASVDYLTEERLRERGITNVKTPYILDFQQVLKSTEFPTLLRDMLALLSKVYDYPVDIEFTANFTDDKHFYVNLLQCRPLQTRGLGKTVAFPQASDERACFFSTKGNFMGGNVRLPIDYVVFIHATGYLQCNEQRKYAVARQVGKINAALKGKNAMLMGPGRWGTTTPSLGVPVHFTELCNMSVICEVASVEGGLMPELSYGSHFFQDLVETGIFYSAIFAGREDVAYHPEIVLERENLLTSISPEGASFSDVIHIAATDGMEVFSDIVTQRLICLIR